MRPGGALWLLLLPLLVVAPQPQLHARHTADVSIPSPDLGPAPSALGPEPNLSPVILQATAVATLGANATLDCTVLHQGDRQVSWVRRRDLQILSHAGAVFTGDSRVVARQTAPTTDHVSRHVLVIQRVKSSDQGAYECQLNTEPKLSVAAHLSFTASPPVVPAASTSSGGDGVQVVAVSHAVVSPRGGVARLGCACVRQSHEQRTQPLRLHWYRGAQPVELQDGRISLESEQSANRAESRLLVRHVSEQDGGQYRCQCERDSDTVTLTVDDVANDEALSQSPLPSPRSAAGTPGPQTSYHALLAVVVIVLFYSPWDTY